MIDCMRNVIVGNTLTDQINPVGLEGYDFYNNVTMNKVTNSTFGVYVSDLTSAHNLIYNNVLNSTTVVDNGLQDSWNSTKTLRRALRAW